MDVGLGAHPWTTLELVKALEVLEHPPEVVGVDVDARVVAGAREVAPEMRFEVGDLQLAGVRARLVRVMNVLRDRGPEEVPAAHARLGSMLVPGGVLIEGSCGPSGEVGVVHRIRRTPGGLVREGLWMWTTGERGTAPLLFRDRLPRDLRRSVHPGHALGELMAAWMEAYRAVPERGLERLAASVRALGRPELRGLGPGAVQWAPPGGVPAP